MTKMCEKCGDTMSVKLRFYECDCKCDIHCSCYQIEAPSQMQVSIERLPGGWEKHVYTWE